MTSRGDDRLKAFSLDSLASYAWREGRLDGALAMLKESLRIRVGHGDRVHVADTLGRLAAVLARAGDAVLATRLVARSVDANAEIRPHVPCIRRRGTRRRSRSSALS